MYIALHLCYNARMEYDFDTLADRRNSFSLKWSVAQNVLPMWVADMDFATAPEIRAAIESRAAHGIFGYSVVPDEWYRAVSGWWRARHRLEIPADRLAFCTGVVPALSSAVRKLTTPAEQVAILTPVYNIFFNSILNNGRRVLEVPLRYDAGLRSYSIDFDGLEAALSQPQTTLLIFCNPHNPVGRIWSAEELAHVGDLCARHGVTVVSDEIHCDLCDPGAEYVPFSAASRTCRDVSLTAVAPTKTFNLAGLQTAAVFSHNEFLFNKINRAINTDEVAEPNAFAVTAAVAAFTEGAPWLDALRAYLLGNKQLAARFLAERLPQVHLVPSQATYLLWLDCHDLLSGGMTSRQLAARIRARTGLYLSEGGQYGAAGEGFLRMNIATSRANVQEGLRRLEKALQVLREE